MKGKSTKTATTETHMKLPKIKLSKYDGNINEWLNFKDLFCTLVHHSKTISTYSKVHIPKEFIK